MEGVFYVEFKVISPDGDLSPGKETRPPSGAQATKSSVEV